jgi:hypothetical protein
MARFGSERAKKRLLMEGLRKTTKASVKVADILDFINFTLHYTKKIFIF